MAWYWEYGKEECLLGLHNVTATHHLHVDTMEMDMNFAADRSPVEESPKFMRLICKSRTGSSNMPIDLSPSSKRSIHNLFCLDTPSNVDSMPDDSTEQTCISMHSLTSFETIECDPETLCEPPTGAEEMPHDDCSIFSVDDSECWTHKRQRIGHP
mmetsp:Transcript_17144/g.36225  ORF Transcript_17144/g.36225 Transcript_17144/m.36225 type:complete len:155 (-) Transcript_17144:148-612(-)